MEQCIHDAVYHLDCAKQALEASLTDPERWKRESDDNTKLIARLLPMMTLLSLSLPQTHIQQIQETEENSRE